MGATVIVNMMTVVHKKSGGVSVSFPDVCKTPTPGGPIPIPYPNIAMSSDTAKGSKKVKIDGESIMHEGSNFKMSSGDEAGSAQGVVSNKIKGKAYPKAYSMDVKVEGKSVFRQLDIMLQNGGSPTNTPPIPEAQAPGMASPIKNTPPPEVMSAEWNATKLKCGDEVVAKIETKNYNDGDEIGVSAISDQSSSVLGVSEPVKGDKCDIPWVTRTGRLPSGGGGVKLDLVASGAGGMAMSGTPLEIEVPANVQEDPPTSPRRVPELEYIKASWWKEGAGFYVPKPGPGFKWKYGHEFEIKDGYFYVRGRIKLVAETPPIHPEFPQYPKLTITSALKTRLKQKIEGYWNRKWREHRVACKRGDQCNCGKGCCSFPMKFECVFVNSGEHCEVNILPGNPYWYVETDPNDPTKKRWSKWWTSGRWFENTSGESSNGDAIWAHEWGHAIGQYDEYVGGGTKVDHDSNFPSVALLAQPPFPNVPDSLMGSGQKIKINHLEDYDKWFNSKVGEKYKPIKV